MLILETVIIVPSENVRFTSERYSVLDGSLDTVIGINESLLSLCSDSTCDVMDIIFFIYFIHPILIDVPRKRKEVVYRDSDSVSLQCYYCRKEVFL